MRRVTVLYEDESNKGQVKDFGLHALLLACLADERGDHSRWTLKRQVTANPRKGNDKLYDTCANEKHLNERDKFLNGIADDPSRALRDCILGHVESLQKLRDHILTFLNGSGPSSASPPNPPPQEE